MSKLHEQRWNAARKLFEDMVNTATKEQGLILYDGLIMEPSQITITDDIIYVKVGNIKFIQFQNDGRLDGGLYHTIEDFKINMLASFSVVKKINFA